MAKPVFTYLYLDKLQADGVVVTASSTIAGSSPNNVLHPHLGIDWRSNAVSECGLFFDMGSAITMNTWYLVGTNRMLASIGAYYKLFAHTSYLGSTLGSWAGADYNGVFSNDGTYKERYNLYHFLSSSQTKRYWAVFQVDAAPPAGYTTVIVPRAFAGVRTSLAKMCDERPVETPKHIRNLVKSEAGQKFGALINRQRTMSYNFTDMEHQDRKLLQVLFDEVGDYQPFISHLENTGSLWAYDNSILYGSFTDPSLPFNYTNISASNLSTLRMNLEEAL